MEFSCLISVNFYPVLQALRLADLGARVIKIERPEMGDICRTLYISNLELDGDSTLFHSINRNKEAWCST